MMEFVLAFFGFAFFQYDHSILLTAIFLNFTVSFPYCMSFISLFVLILQCFPFVSPYIFLTIFRSHILIALISAMNRISNHTFFSIQNYKTENMKVNGYWEDLDVDEKVILNWVSKKYCVKVQTGLDWLRLSSLIDIYEPRKD